jgi:hypothetical protein
MSRATCRLSCVVLIGAFLASACHAADLAYDLVNRALTQSGPVIALDAREGEGAAWLKSGHFTSGRISVEVKGADLDGRSFVGVAFGDPHGRYGVVYLRPFNFNSKDPLRRAHAVQYVYMPDYPWQLLREKFPGKYETALAEPVPADSWVTLVVDVDRTQVRVSINGAAQPVLTVDSLGPIDGRVGLWVGNDSSGSFRHLRVAAR